MHRLLKLLFRALPVPAGGGVVPPLLQAETRTQSTSMVCGKAVLPSGLPGQYPPTATFRIMKNGWSYTHWLPLMLAGVTRKYSWPSRYQTIKFGDHSTAYVWKASPSADPIVLLPPMPPEPE